MDLCEKYQTRICGVLNFLASSKNTITYKDMADFCLIPSPLSIRKLSEFLSQLMVNEIKSNLPIRSSLVVSKNPDFNGIKIPSKYFFEIAKFYNIYSGPLNGIKAIQFHKIILNEVYK